MEEGRGISDFTEYVIRRVATKYPDLVRLDSDLLRLRRRRTSLKEEEAEGEKEVEGRLEPTVHPRRKKRLDYYATLKVIHTS